MRETVRLSREKVFDLAWSAPKGHVAKDLGISDVAFTKICRKLSVPMPPQGYWARKRRPNKPKLLPTKGPTFHDLRIPEIRSIPDPIKANPEAAQLIAFEKDPRNKIAVGKKLRSPHPLVTMAKGILQGSPADNYGRIRTKNQGFRNVKVCPSSLDRAMRILDALLKSLIQRKCEVKLSDDHLKMTLLGETHSFVIEERCRQVHPELTREEKRLQKKRPWMFRKTYQGTGLLSLKVLQNGRFLVATVSDGRRQRMEDRLNQVVIYLVRASLLSKADRQKRQQWEAERRRQEEEIALRERLRAEEMAKVEQLKQDATRWEQARILLAFVEEVRRRAEEEGTDISLQSREGRWLAWAISQANNLDPLKKNYLQGACAFLEMDRSPQCSSASPNPGDCE